MTRAGYVERFGSRLYRSLGSIRFRLALVYSVLLFGLGAIAVGGIYWGLARNLDESSLSQSLRLDRSELGGELAPGDEQTLRELLGAVETQSNERAMEQLADYSLFALAVLFGGSMVVGWFLAGHVLKPVGRITAVARRISATDLSQRIALDGPPDELRRLADTFDAMLDRLDRSFDAQRGFVEDASHELRNPLAVIRSNLDTTLADPDATTEDYRVVAEQVSRSTERMSRVVDDLVTFARHETRPQHLALVDVGELSRQATAEFEGYAANHDVRLTHYAPSGLLALGDAGSLRQALANLLSNALSVAPAGSEVRITAGGEGAWIWVAVEDQGPGIPADEQERVFQRFQRGRQAAAEGRGLGLAIVRQIAESHRGEARLTSTEGFGSTFTMLLPATGASSPGARIRRSGRVAENVPVSL
ncbi:MAG: HAMP domain-containing histidine kinase [Acidimicrobiia bacterium]|nr:HAMP domain-containing histidine kinase [Acidimicrobiia bacterium]MYC46638.1 HAMP domain-containing histidine kinase [Acidimicrobiia bacterium]